MRPHQFLGHEIIHARALVDLRKLVVVAERIRIPSDLHIHAKILLEISLAHQNLPHQRLAIGHVEIGLNPHPADHFPAAFLHPLFDLGKQVGILLLHPLIGSRRRHGELEIGILPHQIEHAAERIANHLHRLRPRPQPGHVDMRIAHRLDGELLQPGLELRQFVMRAPERCIEARLIAFVQRAQINGLDRRIHLLLALGFAFFVRRNDRAGLPGFQAATAPDPDATWAPSIVSSL